MDAWGNALPTVDVVDDVLALGHALRAAVTLEGVALEVRVVVPTWVEYAAQIVDVARFVIVRGELVDHVPTVLKVRALRAAGARPVVVCDEPSAVHVARLREARAHAVLTREHDLHDLLAVLRVEGKPAKMPSSTRVPRVRLSDRQLQLACLYCGHGAPSADHLAGWLGLPSSSVRTHLQRARRALGAANRRELRERLIDEGWMDVLAARQAMSGMAPHPRMSTGSR